MADPTEKKPPIKVVDRRSFTRDGVRREGEPAEPEEAPSEPAAGAVGSGDGARSGPRPRGKSAGEVHRGEGFTMKPPPEAAADPDAQDLAFVNLCVSLYQSGCIHLGLARQEGAPETKPDLEAARGSIDMLRMIQAKTKGNLSEEENRILDHLLAELQMAFVMKRPGQ